jgi:hypothetical protein
MPQEEDFGAFMQSSDSRILLSRACIDICLLLDDNTLRFIPIESRLQCSLGQNAHLCYGRHQANSRTYRTTTP